MRRRCGLPPRTALEDDAALGADDDQTDDNDPNDVEDGEIREEDGESGGPTDTTTPDAPIKLFSEGSETTVVDGSVYGDKDGAAEDDTDADEAKKISDSPGTPHSELVDRGRPLVALPEDLDTDTASGGARNEG
ncbi:hypothetical protein Z517_03862 [Fonsecaea pedrosoi CBS 271.37]|uniref:Uncharacterized protein n=1 Tax=Fonsecaea pedrosoi CBS 271.37 TaxID=1442368 RepID=A0A0D2FDA6_9EURO|nr:uncharacterized protein Z517_03862 [Fonsecaea pedrosoi CBS 271.37]KIW84612.1 hypothetical protein Z517_03862 [Fonsecaea pedrosoi CBS 271.37]